MLIEAVQGPMRANQRTVASAKGIDAAARIVMWTNPEIEARGIDKVGFLDWLLWFDRARTRVTGSYCVVYGVVLREVWVIFTRRARIDCGVNDVRAN